MANFPTPNLDGVDHRWVSVSPQDNEFAVAANLLSGNQPEQIDTTAMVEDYFRNTVTNRLAAYRSVFDTATNPACHPVLFHCTAGKDRTGFVAAVLLRLLGVDESVVMDDYLLTNEALSKLLAARLAQTRERIAQQSGVDPGQVEERRLDGIRAMLYTQPSFLQASFDAITERFGTWEAFRRQGLRLDDERFARFVEAVLVK